MFLLSKPHGVEELGQREVIVKEKRAKLYQLYVGTTPAES